jgi:hypothetical protein
MLWRKYRLDWRYAIGELAIVTVGVLIALAIGQWNYERLEKAEEFDILSRLISDIDVDLLEFGRRLPAMDEKEESLLRVMSALADDDGPQNTTNFLNDIVAGANYGWNQGATQRSTFDDLSGSGSLRIIASPEVRAQIVAYYDAYDVEHVRIDERETAYPNISYQLVPRSSTSTIDSVVIESQVESGLSDEFLKERVKVAQEPSFKNHVIAEINLARFIRGVTIDLQVKARNLKGRLQEYQAEIE